MRGSIALALAVLVAGCATTNQSGPPSPEWLVGTWLPMDVDLEFPLACASGLPISYASNGTYWMFEESGVWRLDGDRLTETATSANEDVIDPAEVSIGRPFTNRIRRVGPNEMRKTFEDGTTSVLLRCPRSR